MTANYRHTEKRGRGRPPKAGQLIIVSLRLRGGRDDDILQRLAQLPPGHRSDYIRRVLAGAPVEALDLALSHESAQVRTLLDTLGLSWGDDAGDG